MTTTAVMTPGIETVQRRDVLGWPLAGEVRADLLRRFPARPVPLSWPATEQGREEVLHRLLRPPFVVSTSSTQRDRRLAVVAAVSWLQAQDGATWQQRWLASGAEQDPRGWLLLASRWRNAVSGRANQDTLIHSLGTGLGFLIVGDVIRPSIDWLLRTPAPRRLAEEMARIRDGSSFAALAAQCDAAELGLHARRTALHQIAVIMAAKGAMARDITVGDCVELQDAAAQLQVCPAFTSPVVYQLLHAWGCFPPGAPPLHRTRSRGQLRVEELVDRYDIGCRPIRDLLVDYLKERQPSLDYTSLDGLAHRLVKLFWHDLEAHHPGLDTLRLPADVAAAWKQRVRIKTTRTVTADGQALDVTSPRLEASHVLISVRAFYLDIAEWALEDPSRWGPWATKCPISPQDVGSKKQKTQRKARMDQRTRERLPVLPLLIAAVDQERRAAAERLHACRAATAGETFTAGGQTLRRVGGRSTAPAQDPATGRRRDLAQEEHRAFWTWAIEDVLRLTGIRIEELTELSHHSLIQYRLPTTGELIPLLQIVPSKTDEERLLVVSPELADVLSAIICRIRDDTGAVPLVSSYDRHERVTNPPMPLLFQWRRKLVPRPLSEKTIRTYLTEALTSTGVTDPSGQPLRFVPHDLRRLFITDAIMHGMPPHIAQLVAGHRDINTTMGYKAVYPEEVINGHRAFIARRRALRPGEEYRTPTDEEWQEFIGNFERRKVELGDCGRSYATACIHEHACLRCPLLRPDPAQRPRLIQIHANLQARIAEAQSRRWLGEAEGLTVSLTSAEQKIAQLEELAARRATVHLDLPRFPDIAARTITAPGTPS